MRDLPSEVLQPLAASTPARTAWGRRGAGVVSLAVSAALLVVLYRSMNIRLIGETLLRADKVWLVVSIGMILPITVLRAIRFLWVAPAGTLPGIGEALRLTLAASALNVLLPAKAGDLIKSYFVVKRGKTSAGVAVAIILYERLCDVFALVFWCLLGWLVGRPQVQGLPSLFWPLLGVLGVTCAVLILSERAAARSGALLLRLLPHRKVRGLQNLAEGWPNLLQLVRGRRRRIVPWSLLIWIAHLFQIWMFTVALSADLPLTVCMSLSALALMAGQLPLTIAGLGTRDVALVVLLSGYMRPESAAALGILISTRNLLPPLLGVPVMKPYLSSVLGEARRWRSEREPVE